MSRRKRRKKKPPAKILATDGMWNTWTEEAVSTHHGSIVACTGCLQVMAAKQLAGHRQSYDCKLSAYAFDVLRKLLKLTNQGYRVVHASQELRRFCEANKLAKRVPIPRGALQISRKLVEKAEKKFSTSGSVIGRFQGTMQGLLHTLVSHGDHTGRLEPLSLNIIADEEAFARQLRKGKHTDRIVDMPHFVILFRPEAEVLRQVLHVLQNNHTTIVRHGREYWPTLEKFAWDSVEGAPGNRRLLALALRHIRQDPEWADRFGGVFALSRREVDRHQRLPDGAAIAEQDRQVLNWLDAKLWGGHGIGNEG